MRFYFIGWVDLERRKIRLREAKESSEMLLSHVIESEEELAGGETIVPRDDLASVRPGGRRTKGESAGVMSPRACQKRARRSGGQCPIVALEPLRVRVPVDVKLGGGQTPPWGLQSAGRSSDGSAPVSLQGG